MPNPFDTVRRVKRFTLLAWIRKGRKDAVDSSRTRAGGCMHCARERKRERKRKKEGGRESVWRYHRNGSVRIHSCCSLTWTARTASSILDVSSGDDIVSYLPLSHVAAQMTDIHGALAVGVCCWCAQPDALKVNIKLSEERRRFWSLAVVGAHRRPSSEAWPDLSATSCANVRESALTAQSCRLASFLA